MNYDKQTALTEKKLLELRDKQLGYRIICIPHYPNNRIHLEARLHIETGFSITRNMDGYILKYKNGESVLQPENKWVVMANDSDKFPNCFNYNKVFNDVDEAVDYVCNVRKIQLKEELENIEKLR